MFIVVSNVAVEHELTSGARLNKHHVALADVTRARINAIEAQHPDWMTTLSNNNGYTNVNGAQVHLPAYSTNGVPAGATAICRDGTYSFSLHHSGTCSHHAGVATWLQ
jgi:hypothetical protein